MSATSSEQAKTLFIAAMEHTPEQRREFLDQTCGSDDALKQRVRKLLAAHEIADQVLPDPPGSSIGHSLDADPPRDVAGKHIGRYTLERVIAVGGMAVVYEARQENPDRTIALKVMKASVASRSALRRFEFETQTLARLAHPNIARIHDAGLHDDPAIPGDPVPYFAMELIPSARTLIEYANENDLRTRDRLELFIPVCDAVHHGHQKGVIHRDLKPGNILVDADGCPKIIDFGVARATDSDLSVTATHTDAGKVIGTVQYMSPEQAAGKIDDIDTRSDVYSLGVVAYELLAAKLPYDLRDRLIHEAVRIIQQDKPAALGTINRTLRGDIETIVAKALEKDPAHRYQSAADLARDVERFLAGEPIEAKRDSPTYVLRKHLRKHKLPVAVAAAFLIVIFAGLAASLTFWQRAVHERDVAQAARVAETEQRARAEANFRTARDAVDQMLSEVGESDLANVPGMAPIRRALLEKALKFHQGFLEQEGDDPAARLETALAHSRVANIHAMLLERSEELTHQEQALSLLESLAADIADRPDQRVRLATVLTNVADLLKGTGGGDATEKKYRQAIALWTELTAETPSSAAYQKGLAETYFSLAGLLSGDHRLSESVQTSRQALQLFAALAADSPAEQLYAFRVGECHGEIGICLAELGQARQAVAPLQQAVEAFESLVELHPESSKYRERVGLGHFNLGLLLTNMGRSEDAERADRKAIDAYEQLASDFPARPEYHRMLADCLNNLGVLLWQSQRLNDAQQVFRRVLSMHEQFIEKYPDQAIFPSMAGGTAHNLAMVLGDQDADPREVSSLFEQAIAHQQAALRIAPHNTRSREYLRNHYDSLFDTLEKLDEFEQAEQAVRRGLEIARKLAADFPETVRYRNLVALSLYNLGNRLQKSQRFDEAVPPYSEALQICIQLTRDEPDVPRHSKDVANTYRQLGITHFRADDWPAAADALEKAVELAGDDGAAYEWFYLAMTRWQLGDKDRAREFYDRAVEWTQENEPETEEPHQLRAEAAQLLGIKK